MRDLTRREALRASAGAAFALGAGGSLLSACGGAAQDKIQPAKTPADTLVVAVEGDVDTFDPGFTVGSKPSQTTLQNVFDQLTQYKQVTKELAGVTFDGVDTEQVVGMLAEKVEERGSAFIFTLREGVKYHDGTPVTAQAVAEGYARIFETEAVSSFLLGMAGVTKRGQVRALDDRRVEIRATKANLLLLKNNTMHNTAVLNPAEVKKRGTSEDPYATDYFKKHVATGNGPFMFDEYRPGDRIVMRANPDYYGPKPKLKRVIQKIVPEATERVLLLKRGEVDMIMIPPVKELDDLKQDASLRVLSFPNPRNFMLELHAKKAPFDKREVRQAVAWAVPYKDIVERVFRGYAQDGKSLIGNGMPGSDFSLWTYSTDLDKAAERLRAAGYPEGKGAPPITITVRTDWEEAERSAILIQGNLTKLGLKVSVDKLAFAQFNEREQGKKLQAFIDEWLSWVNDPWYHMSWNVRSTSPSNYTEYANPTIDGLIERHTLSTDEDARLEGAREAQRILAQDVPHVYLCQPNWNVVLRKDVQGYVYYNDELNRYAYMSKERA